jgi:membrane dipeptidase
VRSPSCVLLLCLCLAGCGAPAGPATDPSPTPSPVPSPSPTPVPLPPVVADLHVDTVTAMLESGVGWSSSSLEASLEKMLAGGVNVVVEALWVERGVPDPRGRAIEKLRRVRNAVLQSQRRAAIVSSPEQLEAVLREGRLAVVLALEGGTALVDGDDTLAELRSLGVSMIGLTWSESSPYADSSAEPRDPSGLTDAGRSAVAWCNARGIMIDVSHMSDAATAEAVALSNAPVLASHSNARSGCDVPRNLPDDLIRAIAAKGGLVGAMFHGPYVRAGRPASRADAVSMIGRLVGLAGVEHVGIGSDWDGIIVAPEGLEGADRLPALRDDLKAAGLDEAAVAGISGGNFLRLWQAVWAARAEPPAEP